MNQTKRIGFVRPTPFEKDRSIHDKHDGSVFAMDRPVRNHHR